MYITIVFLRLFKIQSHQRSCEFSSFLGICLSNPINLLSVAISEKARPSAEIETENKMRNKRGLAVPLPEPHVLSCYSVIFDEKQAPSD